MEVRNMELMLGTSIQDAADQMVELAKRENVEVHVTFNGTQLVAVPTTVAKDLATSYLTTIEERHQAWEASPEGQEALARRAEAERRAAAAEAEGVLPFQLKEGEQEWWAKYQETNSRDPYSACTLRYAARWANLMEQKLQQGATLKDIAESASHEADLEGITGFMYGCSVGCLSKVWVHGEELRRWHNLKTQIRNEGEKANESGGVLNPACLTIG